MSEPTPAGGAILSAEQVREIAYRKAGYPLTLEGVQGYADSLVAEVVALCASHTALTARLEAVEQQVERTAARAVEVLMGRCEAPDHHGPPTWEEFLAGGGTACPMCLTACLAEAEADAEEARTVTRQADAAAIPPAARLLAVERERAAQDARWRALVEECSTAMTHALLMLNLHDVRSAQERLGQGMAAAYAALGEEHARDGAPGAG